jgi:hypothetical protein
MSTDFDDHASLILALGGAAKVAIAADTLAVNARAWAARNRIPPEYWPGVIALAGEQSLVVDADWLMRTTPARANRATAVAEEFAA